MRNRIYKILQKFLHKFGIYTQFYPSAKAIHYHLKSKPIIIQNYELNKVCKTIRSANDLEFYSRLLKSFVPEWTVEIIEPSFVLGGGGGDSSLDCFRKVKIGDSYYFEKVYYSQHDDLKRIIWFHEKVSDLLNNYGIVAPKFHNLCEGEAFVIVYHQFLNLKKFNSSAIESNFITLAKKIYRASADERFIQMKNNAPDYITNFRAHFEYRNKISQAKHRLTSHNISTEIIENDISSSKHVLTHGDIQEKNAFQGLMLIDWDTFGLYPMGFDVAFTCYHLLISEKIQNLSSTWLGDNFKNDINPEDWRDFKKNFSYFLFVFLASHFRKDLYKELELGLVENIRELNR